MLSVCMEASRTFTISSCKGAQIHSEVSQVAGTPVFRSLAPERHSGNLQIALRHMVEASVQAMKIECFVHFVVASGMTVLQVPLQAIADLQPQDVSACSTLLCEHIWSQL